MINEQKEKSDILHVLNELQKIQRAFLFEVGIDIKLQYREKDMLIIASAVANKTELEQCSKLFAGLWRFESFRPRTDLESMLDDIRKTMLNIQDYRRKYKTPMRACAREKIIFCFGVIKPSESRAQSQARLSYAEAHPRFAVRQTQGTGAAREAEINSL